MLSSWYGVGGEKIVDNLAKVTKKKRDAESRLRDGTIIDTGDHQEYIGGPQNGIKIFVQTDQPTTAKAKDLWVDTDDYSRYDVKSITGTATLSVSDNEVITVSGTFTLTLHEATMAGIIKKIHNTGTGIVTLAGLINGVTNMYLYPGESVELITDGTGWRC